MTFGLVIFDCDGVLVDSEPIANRVTVEVCASVGLRLSPAEATRTFIGRSVAGCLAIIEERIGRTLPDDFRADWERRMHDAFAREVVAMPGVADVLDGLRVPFCVASSGSHERMGITLGRVGLLDRCRGRIFSSGDVARGKPFPDVYLHAAATLGVAPERCAVVEDTVVGVQAGMAAGMTVFGFARDGLAVEGDLAAAGARTFSEMRQLPALLG